MLSLVACGEKRVNPDATGANAVEMLGSSCEVAVPNIQKIQEVGPLLTSNAYYRTDQLNDFCLAMETLTTYYHVCDLSPEQADVLSDLYLDEMDNYDHFCS